MDLIARAVVSRLLASSRARPAQTQPQPWGAGRTRSSAAASRPVTRSTDAALGVQRAALDGSRSLSTLLQKRSEARPLCPLLAAVRSGPLRAG